MHVEILQKNEFVENVWPANSALIIYVSTNCVETVKCLDYNRNYQLTRWCSGNASTLNVRGSGFNSRLQQVFLCLIFCFVVVFLLCVQNTLFVTKFCNFFCNVKLFMTDYMYKGIKIQTKHLQL